MLPNAGHQVLIWISGQDWDGNNFYNLSVRKPDGRRQLGRPRRGWMYIIIITVNGRLEYGLNLFGSVQGQLNTVMNFGGFLRVGNCLSAAEELLSLRRRGMFRALPVKPFKESYNARFELLRRRRVRCKVGIVCAGYGATLCYVYGICPLFYWSV